MKAGFPRFKPIERVRSFTYPQSGFELCNQLCLSMVGKVQIRRHRKIREKIKTLTIKRTLSGKWYAIFTSEIEFSALSRHSGRKAGLDLGVEHFAYLSDGIVIQNPRHMKQAEEKLKWVHRQLSSKNKGSRNRRKARVKIAIAHENLMNKRRDFLHKTSKKLVESYSLIAMEDLDTQGLARGFLAKHILDCGWAEFTRMLHYKAEEAGSEVCFVNPANTSQKCSSCGLVRKKKLAEREHKCSCGAVMHRDLNAAINILKRATSGTGGSNASGDAQVLASMKEEVHDFELSSSRRQPYA
jgi:putative transposase